MNMPKDGLQVSLWINMQIADDYLLATVHHWMHSYVRAYFYGVVERMAVNVAAGNIRSWFYVMSSPSILQRIRYFCSILQQDFCPVVSK
jgi:hypothetical protein